MSIVKRYDVDYYMCDFNHPCFGQCKKIMGSDEQVFAFIDKNSDKLLKILHTCVTHTWWGRVVTGSYDPYSR